MYAIIDVETTGGKFNEEGITEIAIYRFDGNEIVDQFSSLLNPERPIHPYVVNLTGINEKMLRTAPKFYEVAKRIIEITSDAILVAHNANFDYRIIKTEFDRLGYAFEKQTLCTVELSKKLIPGKESYSLGKLVRSLGIPIADRHRATGDALATVKLFKLLLNKDIEKQIVSQLVRSKPLHQMDNRLLNIINQLPAETGLYYFHDSNGEVIYVGKSKNIKKRVNQHFTGQSRKAKKMQEAVRAVTYEKTGSELIALLKESEEIKQLKPKFNVSQRKSFFEYALFDYYDDKGYRCLKIEKNDGRKKSLTTFTSFESGREFLFKLCEQYQLCQKHLNLYPGNAHCFGYQVKKCNGACVGKEAAEAYNMRVFQALTRIVFHNQSMVLIDKGRSVEERAVVYIENGVYKGYAYTDLSQQISRLEILKELLHPMQHNRDVQRILQHYIRSRKTLKIIHL